MVNGGITCTGIAPVGTKLFNTTGPSPDGKFPKPCDVPDSYTATGLAHIVSFSSGCVGTPTARRLVAVK